MRHITEGTLQRLEDEPLAVPDRVIDHVAHCERCRVRRAGIAADAERAAHALSAPALVPDTELAWARTLRELRHQPRERALGRRVSVSSPRRLRVPALSLRAGLSLAAVGAVIAGTAAAATLTSVFAPTRVAPVAVSQGDLRAIGVLVGLGDTPSTFATSPGASSTRFGTITWSSTPPRQASTAGQASALAGFKVRLPARLPGGVGAIQRVVVQPRARATVTFNSRAGTLAGSTVTLTAGPAVLVQYAAAGGNDLPTLAVVTMPRPVARSTGANIAQIEAFLLRQPGVPVDLSEQIRLLGDVRSTLPIPIPPGAASRRVRIDGQPGVLVSDGANAAAGVVWEDGQGMVHVVAGVLNRQDVVDVARQLG